MTRRFSPPPDRHPRTPKLQVPPGACDCHFHIIGPQAIYPLHPDRAVDIEDSTLEDFLALQKALGLSRGLIVQSGLHKYSHEHLLHVLTCLPDRLRGVAIPAPGITDAELEILTRAGVVGARFYSAVSPDIDVAVVHRVHEFGWHPHYLVRGEEQALAWRDKMLASPGNFVIEHAGWQPPERGIDGAGFRVVLECLDTGRCWVKLSPRFSAQPTLPFADTLPFIRTLVERAPERMVWGSDWPHPNYFDPMPNDADLLDMMLDWVPDEATRNRILVDNPAEIFGFPPVAGH
jgi:2-pyrone-4,6-dicarboxylate lactonase